MSEVLEKEITAEGWIDRVANELSGGVFDKLDSFDQYETRLDATRMLLLVLNMIRQPTPLMVGSGGHWSGMLDRATWEVENAQREAMMAVT